MGPDTAIALSEDWPEAVRQERVKVLKEVRLALYDEVDHPEHLAAARVKVTTMLRAAEGKGRSFCLICNGDYPPGIIHTCKEAK